MRKRGNGGIARAFWTAAAAIFTIMMLAPLTPAYMFTGDVHTTVTVGSTDVYWSDISLSSSQTLTFKFSVTSGSSIHVYLLDNDELYTGLSGGLVTMHTKDEYTRSVDRTWSTSGTYALVLESTGSSTVKVDITRTTSSISDESFSMLCVGGVILGIIVLIVIVVVVARRRSAQPQQPYGQQGRPPMGPTPSGYPQAAPQYQGYQGPPRPPAGYPQPAQQYPQQQYPQQQYPQQYPQAGYGAQAPAATMVACKYCGLQIPSNSTVCSRCGGRL